MGCICAKNEDKKKSDLEESQVHKNIIQNINDLAEFDLIYEQKEDRNFLSVKVQLFVSCINLYKFDRNVKKNVLAVLYSISNDNSQDLIEEGRTEICMDSINPLFIKTFILNYRFQDENTEQKYIIQIFFIKNLNFSDDLSQQIFLGEGTFNLRDAINSRNQIMEIKIQNKKLEKIENLGLIKIRITEREENFEFLSVKFGIRELISKNPIVLKIHVKKHIDDWWPIYLSKHIQQKSKITFWENTEIPWNTLHNNIGETKIKFEVIEYLKNDKIKSLGSLQMNVKDFEKAPPETEITLSRRFKNYLLIQDFKKFNRFKFFDYLISDLNIKLFVFMDFTNSKINRENYELLNENNSKDKGNKVFSMNSPKKKDDYFKKELNYGSNTNKINKFSLLDEIKEDENMEELVFKDKNQKILSPIKKVNLLNTKKTEVISLKKLSSNSFHPNISKNHLNYVNSIYFEKNKPFLSSDSMRDLLLLNETFLNFFLNFDSDGKYPMFCFGAKLPGSENTLNNCFSATLDMLNPEVRSFIESYNTIIEKVEPGGPAILNECMDLYLRFLKNEKITNDYQFYSIAVFICTSTIIDVFDFVENLKESAVYPSSILIITVGKSIDKSIFECFNTRDFSEISKESYKEIVYNPIRYNVNYINFEDLKNTRNLKSESELKPILKKIFRTLTLEVSDYYNFKNIYPFDYLNLKTKTVYNYMQYKLRCKDINYEIPEYLIKFKNEILLEIFKMGFDLKEVEESFEKFASFDKQYIFNLLHSNRLKSNKSKFRNNNHDINYNKEADFYNNDNNYEQETADLKCIIYRDRNHYIQVKNTNTQHGKIEKKQNEKNKKIDSELQNKTKMKLSEDFCNICNDKKINIAFGDCKHRYLCEDCLSNKIIYCPICKNKIKKFIKLYRV